MLNEAGQTIVAHNVLLLLLLCTVYARHKKQSVQMGTCNDTQNSDVQMGKIRDAPAARNRFAGCRNLDVKRETSHPTASSGPETARMCPSKNGKESIINLDM
jgi:hypothetical protein